jgi:DNA-binding CsgD family transcriptional regulator
MSLWQRLLNALGYQTAPRLSFRAELGLIQSLQVLAKQEHRGMDEVAIDLLSFALEERQAADHRLIQWQMLSPREQEVTALICLNYTNRRIATRLKVSPETIKTHVRHLLRKFEVSSKAELRQALADWDFSAWIR